MTIKELHKGDFFTLRDISEPTEKQVYIRGDYDRATKKFECVRFDDANSSRLFPGNKTIFTNFTF